MDIFIDSADIDEIKTAISWGIVDGITTNPSLIKAAHAKHGGNLKEYISKICTAAGDLPVSLEVIGNTYDQMVKEGRKLHELFNKIKNNVVIKIPINPSMDGKNNMFDGLRAIRTLADEEMSVNVTLVQSPIQALLAAKAGAAYVSPFAGRTDDLLRHKAGIAGGKYDYFPEEGVAHAGKKVDDDGIVSGVNMVSSVVSIFDNYEIDTLVLAASVRNVRQLRELAEVGADIATVPFSVLAEALNHSKTLEGMKKFTEDVVPEYKQLFD